MIPKIIHYCWFGHNPLPQDAQQYIASWRHYLPDYEIKEWNESNFDVTMIPYIKEAYEAKKYAFVSDFARFWILYHYGGLYFDTDVEVIRPLDDIIAKGAFMGCELSPTDTQPTITVAPGLGLGVEAQHPFYKEMLDLYRTLHFLLPNGKLNLQTIVTITTDRLMAHGLKVQKDEQTIAGITIYPKDYFCPINVDGTMNMTARTCTIHHYAQSWRSPLHRKLREWIIRLGGNKLRSAMSKCYTKLHQK